jgi:hypothetical protein
MTAINQPSVTQQDAEFLAIAQARFSQVASFVYDSEEHIERLRAFLQGADLAASERAESRDIFRSAGGITVEQFRTIDFATVRMITFEGLCVRLLLTDNAEVICEFTDHAQLEATLAAWAATYAAAEP